MRREELEGDPVETAPRLLNALLVVGSRVGRIVEVEAYGGADDPASHAYRGPRAANASMFARAGTLYCYRSYGIHTCANIVTGSEGDAQAVLVRAVVPVEGIEAMRRARGSSGAGGRGPGSRSDARLADGPGKLCQALGIELAHDGLDLLDPTSPVRLERDGVAAPTRPRVTTRVGISRAADLPWRFEVPPDGEGGPVGTPGRR